MEFIDATTVNSSLDVRQLVDALREGFRRGCEMPQRHRHERRSGEPNANLVLMPAWQKDGPIGVKVTTIVPGNADRDLPSVMSIYVLFDAITGQPKTVIDGRSLTLQRTAATSALAATYLARTDASRLLMVGTGDLAPYLVRAHCAVRPIEEIVIWGRRRPRAERLLESLRDLPQSISVADDLEAASRAADVISCATLATEALVLGAWLKAGAHLDLVGGFTPQMREVDDEAVRRARLYLDKTDACLAEAGDLIQPIERGVIGREDIVGDLFDLARSKCAGRRHPDEITLFKSVGLALEDLVAAELVATCHNQTSARTAR